MAHAGEDFLLVDPIHLDHDASVVEHQHVARAHVLHQFRIVEADAARIAYLARGVEDELLAGLEQDLAASELADADLRSLQVGHDADGALEFAHARTQHADAVAMVLLRAVGEVEPHHIYAGQKHAPQHAGVGR